MKIGFYLGNIKGDAVDARCINEGNPGLGGTQFVMLSLAHYLNSKSRYQIFIFSFRNIICEEGIESVKVDQEGSVCNIAETMNIDILLLKTPTERIMRDSIQRSKLKVVTWSHNFILRDSCDYISRTSQIVANVFVGKQEFDRYIDDDVIHKSTYIYNMYNDNTPDVCRINDSRTIVYMGAICEGKGFRELASIWPNIKKRVPDARLLVLGSGNLYGNKKLGRFGIAEANYENSFINYLSNGEKIDEDVRFLGVVGKDKTNIFRKCSVGIVNPSGRTETFGMGIVEMAEAKLPVSTIGCGAHHDTICHKHTGLLGKNLHEIEDNIVYLLSNPKENESMGENAKEFIKKFSPEIIGPIWENLFLNIVNQSYTYSKQKPTPPISLIKFIRIANAFLRFNCHLRFIPSIIRIESLAYGILRKLKAK